MCKLRRIYQLMQRKFAKIKTALIILRNEGVIALLRAIIHKIRKRNYFDCADEGISKTLNSDVDYILVKSKSIKNHSDVIILLIFSPDGKLSDIQKKQIFDFETAGFEVGLIVNTPLWFLARDSILHDIENFNVFHVLIRNNVGFDFSGWAQFLVSTSGLDVANTITFTNDSVICVNQKHLIDLRSRLTKIDGSWFLTRNYELKPHGQSYFFGLSGKYIKKIIPFFENIPNHLDKWDAIFHEELHLFDRFTQAALKPEVLYHIPGTEQNPRDTTIQDWKELISQGFPFLKLQLFTQNILNFSDLSVSNLLDRHTLISLEDHLKERSKTIPEFSYDPRSSTTPVLSSVNLYNEQEVLQAHVPVYGNRPDLLLPLQNISSLELRHRRVLVILHVYHVNLVENILSEFFIIKKQLTHIEFELVITTHNTDKRSQILDIIEKITLPIDCVKIDIFENRGRNVAPFLMAAAKYLNGHDLILHLHTKKSPHDINLSSWGDYMRTCVLGTHDNVASIIKLFETDNLGLIYPGHFKYIDKSRNWGYDFKAAKDLMARFNVDLRSDMALDFPAGMMFWVRPDAIKNLINLNLKSSDFEVEDGQIDGTFAHSIERSFSYIVEANGFSTQTVVNSECKTEALGAGLMLDHEAASKLLARPRAKLVDHLPQESNFYKQIKEVYDVSAVASDSDRPRLNIILPSVEPYQIYGGVATAIKQGLQIWRALGSDTDLRFIITLDETTKLGLDEVASRLGSSISFSTPSDDVVGHTLVALKKFHGLPINVRKNDVFFSTAWWTADLGGRLRSYQNRFFDRANKMIYLIQDYEPAFYGCDTKSALARNTYLDDENTIAIINSEELSSYMHERFSFFQAYTIPFQINEGIKQFIRPVNKKRIILVYGRPTVGRNLFPIILHGLKLWQKSHPHEAKLWNIIFVGEDFDPDYISELQFAKVLGKLTLDKYADLLNTASIGVSLMLSPHPSYPPLEMAFAGLQTITNKFDSKDLSRRTALVHNLTEIAPSSIAHALERVTSMYCEQAEPTHAIINDLPTPYPILDLNELLEKVRSNVE